MSLTLPFLSDHRTPWGPIISWVQDKNDLVREKLGDEWIFLIVGAVCLALLQPKSMLLPRLGRLEVLLLLLPLLLLDNDHGAVANVHRWPHRSPEVDDEDDDGGNSLNNSKASKKSNKEKGKMGKYSIPHHLFNDEGS
jgi:hypothetical protein